MKQSLMFTTAKVIYFLTKSKYFPPFLHQFDIKIHMASVSSVHSVRNNNSVRDKKRAKRVTIRVICRAILAQQESEFCNKREQKPNLFGLCRVRTKSRAKRVIEKKKN